MEVHHHPDIRRKDFKEYVLEGLMIFMAVTMGFFAERLRENMAEHATEEEFIISMIEDAKTDISSIRKNIEANRLRVLKLDTLANLCFNYDTSSGNDNNLYNAMKYCIRHPDFVTPVERTLSQLKNSGGMRLIEEPTASNCIINYDEVTKKMVNQQLYYELHLNVLIDATEKIFNMKYFPLNLHTFKWENGYDSISTAKLFNHDKIKLIELGNKAKLFQGIVLFYITRLEETNQNALNLIETLKHEYHID
jgi:hypothetical protein